MDYTPQLDSKEVSKQLNEVNNDLLKLEETRSEIEREIDKGILAGGPDITEQKKELAKIIEKIDHVKRKKLLLEVEKKKHEIQKHRNWIDNKRKEQEQATEKAAETREKIAALKEKLIPLEQELKKWERLERGDDSWISKRREWITKNIKQIKLMLEPEEEKPVKNTFVNNAKNFLKL